MVDMLSFDADDAGYVTELADYVAVPSVSRDAARETMLAAADWLVAPLGFANGRGVETEGHPRGRADDPRLRPLRCAAHRRPRRVDHSPVRADRGRRHRQGTRRHR